MGLNGQKNARIQKDLTKMLKKIKKRIRFSFFGSKKRKIRQRFHIFHQKSPNIQNFITKTVKKATHPQKTRLLMLKPF